MDRSEPFRAYAYEGVDYCVAPVLAAAPEGVAADTPVAAGASAGVFAVGVDCCSSDKFECDGGLSLGSGSGTYISGLSSLT